MGLRVIGHLTGLLTTLCPFPPRICRPGTRLPTEARLDLNEVVVVGKIRQD